MRQKYFKMTCTVAKFLVENPSFHSLFLELRHVVLPKHIGIDMALVHHSLFLLSATVF